MPGAIRRADELAAADARYFIPQQFENPANPAIHRATTAEEIWADTDGQVDIFVAGVGTGGTITGVGEALKAKKTRRAGSSPSNPPPVAGALGRGQPWTAPDPGDRRRFRPQGILNTCRSTTKVQVRQGRRCLSTPLAGWQRQEGLLVGISSGAAVWAALRGRAAAGKRRQAESS
jgi:cysteine synthase A